MVNTLIVDKLWAKTYYNLARFCHYGHSPFVTTVSESALPQ